MNRKFIVLRDIILSFVILITLAATILMGSYVYNKSELQSSYRTELLSFGTYKTDECSASEATAECIEYYKELAAQNTTDKKIAKYLAYGVSSVYTAYESDPYIDQEVTTSEVTDSEGNPLKLFTLRVYRAYFDGDSDADTVSYRFYYIFFIYNVNYDNIRTLMGRNSDEAYRTALSKSDVVSFSLRVFSGDDPTTIDDNGEEDYTISGYKTRTVTQSDDKVVPDYEAVPTFSISETKGTLNYIYTGIMPLSAGKASDSGYDNWYIKSSGTTWSDLRIKMTTSVDDEDVEEVLPDIRMNDFKAGDATETMNSATDLVTSARQDVKKAGYSGWVFKKYQWWACLLTFIVVGLIAGSFYLIWYFDAKEKMNRFQAKKKLKK